jgi:hypothetical protein
MANTESNTRSTRSARSGGKHTVYMSAEQEEKWERSGLTISDVIDRGLEVVPISIDGMAPEELKRTLGILGQVAVILAHGGTVYTPYAAQEVLKERSDPGNLEKLDKDAAELNEIGTKAPARKRATRTRKGQPASGAAPAKFSSDAVQEFENKEGNAQ